MSDISKRYKELNKQDISQTLNVSVNAYSPKLDEADFNRGYVTRYFVQKVNDKSAPIYEVSNKEYGGLKSNSLYNRTSLRWRITGPKQPQFNPKNGEMTDMGVHESNKKSIELASETIPNLKLYLPNTSQFWKNG